MSVGVREGQSGVGNPSAHMARFQGRCEAVSGVRSLRLRQLFSSSKDSNREYDRMPVRSMRNKIHRVAVETALWMDDVGVLEAELPETSKHLAKEPVQLVVV